MSDTGIRVGKVSSLDYENGMMQVVYNDKGKSVTAKLPYANFNNEYNMPPVGSSVLVTHLSNGSSRGVVLGTMWNKKNTPAESGANLYRKEMSSTPGAAIQRYDDGTGVYLIKAPNVQINGINETELSGPKVTIDASSKVNIETPTTSISSPTINLSGGEDEAVEINNSADITFNSEEKGIEAKIKSVATETVEDYGVKATKNITLEAIMKMGLKSTLDMSMESAVKVSMKAGTDLEMECAGFKTTLKKILERLEALDGDSSARK